MAEAMIPLEMRPKLNNDQMGEKIGSANCPNLISMDSPVRIKRKKSSNNVVIAIPAEIKRHKMTHITEGHEVRRIIEAISTAISRGDRLSAIGAACASFNHNIVSIHDDEIQNHCADSVLCKHISFLLLKEQHNPAKKQLEADELEKWGSNADYQYRRAQFDESDEEIGYACSALEMVYRASAPTLSNSFEKLGPELLDLLIAIIYRKTSNRPGSCTQKKTSSANLYDSSVKKATKIMCHLARVGSAVEPMAHHPGILRVLKDIIESRDDNNQAKVFEKSIVNYEACINSLWILGNLACAPGNMSHIMSYPGLQDCLLNVIILADASNPDRVNSPEFTKRIAIAGQAVRVFLNLSWTDENKRQLSNNQGLKTEIIKLISFHNRFPSKKINHLVLSARRHAIGMLRNIAGESSTATKLLLCQENSALILQVLRNIIASCNDETNIKGGWIEEDTVIKERAIATIYNLISKETIDTIARSDGILKSILKLSSSAEEKQGDISKLIDKTLTNIKETMTSDMDCYGLIMGPAVKKESNEPLSNVQNIESDNLIQFASI